MNSIVVYFIHILPYLTEQSTDRKMCFSHITPGISTLHCTPCALQFALPTCTSPGTSHFLLCTVLIALWFCTSHFTSCTCRSAPCTVHHDLASCNLQRIPCALLWARTLHLHLVPFAWHFDFAFYTPCMLQIAFDQNPAACVRSLDFESYTMNMAPCSLHLAIHWNNNLITLTNYL